MAQEPAIVNHAVVVEPITATLYWDTRVCSVCDAEQCIPLPPTATRLLTYLLRHANQLVAAEQLKTVGWYDEPCTNADLYKQMHLLRVALHDTTPPYHCLQTRYGSGYLLRCDRPGEILGPRLDF